MFRPFAADHTGVAHRRNARRTRARPARLLQQLATRHDRSRRQCGGSSSSGTPSPMTLPTTRGRHRRSIEDNERPSTGQERLYTTLEAGHAEIFVAERAATVPSAGILLAIRPRSFVRAASIYSSRLALLCSLLLQRGAL